MPFMSSLPMYISVCYVYSACGHLSKILSDGFINCQRLYFKEQVITAFHEPLEATFIIHMELLVFFDAVH